MGLACRVCMPNKTESCMWCGHSEAYGARLKEKLPCVGRFEKYECMDREACDKRIKIQILKGP